MLEYTLHSFMCRNQGILIFIYYPNPWYMKIYEIEVYSLSQFHDHLTHTNSRYTKNVIYSKTDTTSKGSRSHVSTVKTYTTHMIYVEIVIIAKPVYI